MLVRNLFFIGLVVGAFGLLVAYFLPPGLSPRPTRADVPEPEGEDFRAVVQAVDAAFARQQSEQGLRPAPRAPELTVARRLALGLMGAVPSLQEIRRFEAWPKGARLSWYLDTILRDRRSADYLAERLARAFVGTEGGPFLVYRRRRLVAWLSDQLFANRPYDAVVRELLTSDGLWTDRPATNFVTVTADPNNHNRPNANRLAARISRAFLGVRLDCAQCHNHPFEKRWKQSTFQGLAAFFGQTELGLTGLHDEDREFAIENRKTGALQTVAPRVPFHEELLPKTGRRRERLAAWLTHPDNPYFARATVNRVWAVLFGKPLVEPVDDLVSGGEPPRPLRILAADFARSGYDLRRLVRLIAATDAFRRDSAAGHEIAEEHEAGGAAFPLTRLRPEQVVGGVLQASSLETIDQESHILMKLLRTLGEADFVRRYGDAGEDEFDARGGTIPQRLLLMNGKLVKDRTQEGLFNAATRIGWLAPDDRKAVETAYLVVLTRRPTAREAAHFEARLAGTAGKERSRRLEDLFWALFNSTEFAWNH